MRTLALTVGFMAAAVATGVAADSPGAFASGYTKYSEVGGTVQQVDGESFTLRITWYTLEQQRGNNNNRGRNLGRGGNNRNRNFRRPNQQRPPKAVEHHEDYNLKFAPGGMVRYEKLVQASGGEKFIPPAEQNKLKLPLGAPGWAADKSALQTGEYVLVHLVRPTDVKLKDLSESDLRVRYAIIQDKGDSLPKLKASP